jgi:quinoprotein glucose dehydrogenase
MSDRKTLRLSSVATIALAGAASAQGYTPSTAKGDWPMYFADPTGSRYSPQDQINASNFNKLELAWHFKTDSLGTHPEYKLEGTPLEVNGTVYTTAGSRRDVVALDAKTGELKWVYSMNEGLRAAIAPRQLSGRGVSYLDRRQWRRPHHLCHHRLSPGRTQCSYRPAHRRLRRSRHGGPEASAPIPA